MSTIVSYASPLPRDRLPYRFAVDFSGWSDIAAGPTHQFPTLACPSPAMPVAWADLSAPYLMSITYLCYNSPKCIESLTLYQ